MEEDQAGLASAAGLAQSSDQKPSSTSVEEYLRLTNGRHQPDTGLHCRNGNAVFKDLKVLGSDIGLLYQDTVGAVFQLPARIAHALLSRKKLSKKIILNGIDGVVQEGEMLLVLGRPGSGCTTLLKTLAGMTESFHGWSGVITYSGVGIDLIKKKFRGDVVYNAEGSCLILPLELGMC